MSIGFAKGLYESILYVKYKGNNFLIVSLYVDDLLVTRDDARIVEEFKQEMMQAFEMTDLGPIAMSVHDRQLYIFCLNI